MNTGEGLDAIRQTSSSNAVGQMVAHQWRKQDISVQRKRIQYFSGATRKEYSLLEWDDFRGQQHINMLACDAS